MVDSETVFVVIAAPFFVIRHPEVKHYQSEVFDKIRKGDAYLDMPLSPPPILSGDAKIEFFNKPKMMAKVLFGLSRVIFDSNSLSLFVFVMEQRASEHF